MITKFPIDAEKSIISSLDIFIQHESKALRQSFINIYDVKNCGSLSEAKLLAVEWSEDDGTKDSITSQSITDELIDKSSKIETSMWCLFNKIHNGNVIKTKVINGKKNIFEIS